MSKKTKTKRPGWLKIGPFDFTIHNDPQLCEELGGDAAMHGRSLRIAIDSDNQAPGYLRDSLLHEALHACYQQTGLYDTTDEGRQREEDIIRTLTPRILELMRDNPELVDWLMA